MIYLYQIRAEGSELDGETFHVQATSRQRGDDGAAARIRDRFSLASDDVKRSARAIHVKTLPSLTALEIYETRINDMVSA